MEANGTPKRSNSFQGKKLRIVSCFGSSKKETTVHPVTSEEGENLPTTTKQFTTQDHELFPADPAVCTPLAIIDSALASLKEKAKERKQAAPIRERVPRLVLGGGTKTPGTQVEKVPLRRPGSRLHRSQIVPQNDSQSGFTPPPEPGDREFSPRPLDLTKIQGNNSFLSQPSIISQIAPVKTMGAQMNISSVLSPQRNGRRT